MRILDGGSLTLQPTPTRVVKPKIVSFMERRVATRLPGPAEQWSYKLETEAASQVLPNSLTPEAIPYDGIMIPQVAITADNNQKRISILNILLHLDGGDLVNMHYG